MFQNIKSLTAFLGGAMTAIIAHFAAWLLRFPVEKLYHKLLYLFGHITATLVVMRLFENR
jgi:hypothetical protein